MHVVIVGAGVFGLWSAHALHAAGVEVTVVEAYGVANSRASSGDESRILRYGYGADALYTRMASASMAAWRGLEERQTDGTPLWHRCGVLWLAPDRDTYLDATIATLREQRLPMRICDSETLSARYPHLAAAETPRALLEPESGAILARRSLHALASELAKNGVRFVMRRALALAEAPAHAVRLDDGRVLRGDALVFACGPWLPKLFPEILHGRIRPTRQVVVYFGAPGGEQFGPRHTPAWIDFPSGIYGIPDLDGRGVKVGIDAHGPAFDPDTGDRVADAASIATARAWLERRFPAMRGAPVLETRVCQYENTSTGDFLIDRHPGRAGVWIVGGGSGHGFKHGPAVGAYVAGMVTGAGVAEPRFALATTGTDPARRIY
jgi:glycine/D-amino acid oxidase-like deaminating enzyme